MEIAEIIGEVLKYAVPAVLVLIGMRYMVESQIRKEQGERNFRLREDVLRQHLPLKLAAHERAILFLERISPEQLLSRHSAVNKTVQELRAELISQVRSEYEHNLVQQLYIGFQGWTLLQQAKEEVIALVHQSSEGLNPEEKGSLLARKMLERVGASNNMMYQKAIFVIKQEVQQYFLLKEPSED